MRLIYDYMHTLTVLIIYVHNIILSSCMQTFIVRQIKIARLQVGSNMHVSYDDYIE